MQRAVENQLSTLESHGLIGLAQLQPEYEYLFRHALVQDAAYESLLKADRRALHENVAETIELLYPSRLDEFAAVLAYHYEKAENETQALKYTLDAADSAARSYANQEAANLYQHAIGLAQLGNLQVTNEGLKEICLKYGRALELSGQYLQARDSYRELEQLGQQRSDRQMELVALIAQATIHATPSQLYNLETARELCQRGIEIARALEDLEAQSQILWLLMLASYFNNEVTASVKYGEESLAIARSLNNRERMAFVLNDIVRSYGSSGQVQKAFAAGAEARSIWIETGNQPMLADNLSTHAEGLFIYGHSLEAFEHALQAFEISEKINNTWGKCYSLLIQAYLRWQFGEIQETIRALETIFEWNKIQSVPFAYNAGLILLGEIYTEMGLLEKAEKLVDFFMPAIETYPISFKGPILAFLAYHAAKTGQFSEAEAYLTQGKGLIDITNFNTFAPFYFHATIYLLGLYKRTYLETAALLAKSLQQFEQDEFIAPLPFIYYWYGTLLEAADLLDEALEAFNRSAELAEPMQSRHALWQAQAGRSRIARRRGDQALTDRYQRAAIEPLRYILEHSPADLAGSFGKLPEVVEVLANSRDRKE